MAIGCAHVLQITGKTERKQEVSAKVYVHRDDYDATSGNNKPLTSSSANRFSGSFFASTFPIAVVGSLV
jgi:hypothetical protein